MGHTNNSELSTSSAVGLEQKDTRIDMVKKIDFPAYVVLCLFTMSAILLRIKKRAWKYMNAKSIYISAHSSDNNMR